MPLGGVRNLQVTDPTVSTLNVRWEPAEGSVRQYRIYYQPVTGGAEDMVRHRAPLNYYIMFQVSLTRNTVRNSGEAKEFFLKLCDCFSFRVMNIVECAHENCNMIVTLAGQFDL